ncbi:MAG: hypothetical protein NVSMB21_12360 [Vulcanimicrobiaceae bacterium]
MTIPRLDRRAVLLYALCASLLVAFVALGSRDARGVGPLHDPTDLLAFYCGTRVALAGGDPYRAEPLRSCEVAALAESSIPLVRNLVVPAPLPAYDFALFAPLAPFSFRVACAIWFLVLSAAIVATGVLLQRVTGLRPVLLVYALAGADAGASILLGQLVPLVVLAVVVCGDALRRDRARVAAFAGAFTLVEPHVGLPVVVALALFVPRTRPVLAALCALLGTLALAVVGPGRCIEYATAVLPAQARGEGLEFHRQYGLSALLHAAGMAATTSLRLGSLSYVAMIGLGLALGRRVANVTADRALLVFVPVAVGLIGGAYGHIAQMALALPLACTLVASATGRARVFAIAALVCLAIPWQTIFSDPTVAALFPRHEYVDPTPLLARASGGDLLAEAPWDAWISAIANFDHRTPLEILLGKLPTWFGLVACAVLAARAKASRGGTVSRRDSGCESIRLRT